MLNKVKRLNLLVNRTFFKRLTYIVSIMVNFSRYRRRKELIRGVILDDREEQVLFQLKNIGFAEVSDLFSDDELEELLTNARRRTTENKCTTELGHKSFWTKLLEDDLDTDGKLPVSSLFVKFAQNRSILRIISRYFGMLPSLHYVLLTHSVPQTPDQTSWKISQLWHKDFDGINVLKLFVYLSDVNHADDAPFIFLDKKQSQKVSLKLLHRHMTDDALGVAEDEWHKVYAKKKTVFIVNTSHCYHMGGRQVSENRRLMYTAAFSKAPAHNVAFHGGISYPELGCEAEKLLLSTY